MVPPYGDSVDQIVEDTENQLSAKVVDFKSQLNNQIAFCRIGLTNARDQSRLEDAKGAVDILEATLGKQTRRNKLYKKRMRDLIKSHTDFLNKISVNKRNQMNFYMEKKFYITKYRYLIECLLDEGFGYNEEISEEIDVRGDRGVRKDISQGEKDVLAKMSESRRPTEEVFED